MRYDRVLPTGMAMARIASLLVPVALSCGEGAAPRASTPLAPPVGNAAPSSAAAVGVDARIDAPDAARNGARGCSPLPRAGAPCSGEPRWCVVSWGAPGGHSTALWCRDGRWTIEEERNL